MREKIGVFRLIIASSVLIFAMACANNLNQNQTEAKSSMQQVDTINMAVCVLHPTEGNSAEGTVTFSTNGSGVKVVADLRGLTPGKHGFHIHQYGDCSAPDGTSAGGHFNPENVEHGGADASVRHVGDLGNIEADTDGNAHYERVDDMISLNGKHSIIGRGIIVHAGEDDLTTQPTGAAGARVACGVIGIAK